MTGHFIVTILVAICCIRSKTYRYNYSGHMYTKTPLTDCGSYYSISHKLYDSWNMERAFALLARIDGCTPP